MYPQRTQKAALVTREARLALLDFKNLVDLTAEKIRTAESEAVSMAIGRQEGPDPLRTLRLVAEALQSPDFEAALSQARAKTESAVACHAGECGG